MRESLSHFLRQLICVVMQEGKEQQRKKQEQERQKLEAETTPAKGTIYLFAFLWFKLTYFRISQGAADGTPRKVADPSRLQALYEGGKKQQRERKDRVADDDAPGTPGGGDATPATGGKKAATTANPEAFSRLYNDAARKKKAEDEKRAKQKQDEERHIEVGVAK